MCNGELMSNNKENSLLGKKWFKIFIYVITALLAIFYIVVLWWGKNPDVGIEYKMYYITHELSDWPGFGKLSYNLGDKEICTGLKDRNGKDVDYKVCRRKGKGWDSEQYEGSVSNGKESYLYYVPKLQENDDIVYNVDYTIEVKDFSINEDIKNDKSNQQDSNKKDVTVYINDNEVGTFDKAGTYTFKAGTIKNSELVTIKFVTNNCTFTLWSTTLG